MEKILTAKLQKITPELPANANAISNALTIKPDDETALERKGTLYTVFDVSSSVLLDSVLITNIVNDVLHDAYFQTESTSPIQSVEKAILRLRDNLIKIAKTSGKEETPKFNIATAILWGNTLYLVQYGTTKIFLMRAGQIKPIESSTEGKFSVASGIVKDSDVVILATESFAAKFPPEELIQSSGIAIDMLEVMQASLILKFEISKELNKDDIVDFGTLAPEEEPATIPQTTPLPKQQAAPVKKRRDKTKLIVVGGIVLNLLILYAVFNVLSNKRTAQDTPPAQQEATEQTEISQENTQTPPQINQEEDAQNKVERVTASVFYDLKLVEENANASALEVVGDTLVVADDFSGTLYTSAVSTPKLTPLSISFKGIRNLKNAEGNLEFTDAEGFKVLDLATQEVVESFSQPNLGATDSYLDFIYSAQGDIITKFSRAGDVLEGEDWAQAAEIDGTVSMGIDISIFLLRPDELISFTTGERDEFSLKDLDTPLNNAKEVIINPEFEYIYIADAGNKRVVIADRQGNLVRQLKLENEAEWEFMRGITVTDDEATLYVLAGTKVFEVAL